MHKSLMFEFDLEEDADLVTTINASPAAIEFLQLHGIIAEDTLDADAVTIEDSAVYLINVYDADTGRPLFQLRDVDFA